MTVTIDPKNTGVTIPDDFSGLSFETKTMLPDKNEKHLFSADNKLLIALFKQLGIHNLRIGGNTADNPAVEVPGEADIDNLFAFRPCRGRESNLYAAIEAIAHLIQQSAAKIAAYVMGHYASDVSCLTTRQRTQCLRKNL